MNDLEGLTVVAVEQAVAAPYASARLADAGARVIKVERPTGDFARGYDRLVLGQSAYFVWLNRGKESICLDLKLREDRGLLARMLEQADIYIHNLKPGSLAGMGLDSEVSRARNPRLITCEITGFGSSGPGARLKAYDLIVQAEVGLCSITGNEHGPARVGVSVADIAAGMTAHAAILQALIGRERTGQGRSIQVSLFDSVAEWMNVPLLQHLYGNHELTRTGVAHPTIAPYGVYRCSGGGQLILSVQNDREWHAFCEGFLRRPELATDPRFIDNPSRVSHRDALDVLIHEVLSVMTIDRAMRLLDQTGIACGRLNDLQQLAGHPHLRCLSVATPAGEVRIIAPAAISSGGAARIGSVPALGQDTQRLRLEFATA